MSLSRFRFDPRLLTIKVANTRMAEGLHTVHEKFVALQQQVKESRGKLPLEADPQKALIGELIAKCQACSQQCYNLIRETNNASVTLHDQLEHLNGKLGQLSSLLSAIQNSNTELRPYSFDPLDALITHIGHSLAQLQKAALSENKRWFLPEAILWSLVAIGGFALAIKAPLASAYVFGEFGWALAFLYIFAYAAAVGGIAMVIRQFYRCYRPNSKGLPAPAPQFNFWTESCLAAYVFILGALTFWNCKSILYFITDGTARDPILIGLGSIAMMGGSLLLAFLRKNKTWPRIKNSYGSTRHSRY